MHQIASKSAHELYLKMKMAEMEEKTSTKFCTMLFIRKKLSSNYFICIDGAVVIDKKLNTSSRNEKSRTYCRCIYNNVMYHSKLYTRPTKTQNFFSQLTDSSFVEIEKFTVIDNECYASVRRFYTESCAEDSNVDHILQVTSFRTKEKIIPIKLFKKR